MAVLFEVVGEQVRPKTEILLVEPFKSIWERDTSEGKKEAHRDFTFIEFMSSKKRSNPYSGYSEEERLAKLGRKLYDDEALEIDPLIEEALAEVIKIQTEGSMTFQYYISLLSVANKMKDFFNNIDIDERNDRGVPIYKPADITRAIADVDKVLHTLHATELKVEQELYETERTRGNKEINPYEQ